MQTYRTKGEAIAAAWEQVRRGEILLDDSHRAFIGRLNRRYFFVTDIDPLPPETNGIVGMLMPNGAFINFTGN